MLPDGFQWTPRHQHAQDELALTCDGRHVAQLMRRNTGEWYARLILDPSIHSPVDIRPCQSFESGKAGIEEWARRNEARIRYSRPSIAAETDDEDAG